ncbi:MAG TPA: serine/threonine-protein kinase [Pyrinomonadaceae bacterium]|jgi:serine/threonine protein kinase
MNQSNWQRVTEVFGIAASLQGDERSLFLQNISRQDAVLHSEVLSLLSADEIADIIPNSSAANLIDEAEENTHEKDARQNKSSAGSILGVTLGGRYLIKRRIGFGGMGEVYLASDKNVMNREVVVKILRDEALKNKDVVRKFYHEIEALARVNDEGIVTIYDSGLYNELPFLAMEYVEGEDLLKLISPVLFSVRDFPAVQKLLEQLRSPQTPAARHLWSRFQPEARKTLSDNNSEKEQAECLRDELNILLTDWTLFDEQAFQNVRLSANTLDLQSKREAAGRTSAFNRALIEDAFPGEIRRGENKRFSQTEAADIFRQICIALTHGHHRKIIHRDLKPQNIMLSEREGRGWRVKLIDFGIAKVRESLAAPSTELSGVMGTPIYMSPEQLRGEKNLTPACDIYALGLVAFEMLAGKRVFDAITPIEQYRIQENEEFEDLPALRVRYSPEVEQAIRRALAFKPEERYESAREFGEVLAQALTEKKTAATVVSPELIPPTIPSPEIQPLEIPYLEAPKREKSFPVKWAIAALLLVALTSGGIALWMWTQREKPVEQAAAAPVNEIKRSLDYKLIVQKYYEGKPFQQPFEATGDEIFGDDWRFRLWMNSPQDGNLYLLTEGKDEKGENELTMLFPHPQFNEGKSAVKASQPIETAQMKFDKNQGSEKFWIVWADKPVNELEDVKSFVNPQDLGTIKDSTKEKAVRDFLAKYDKKENLTEQADSGKHLKTVKSTSDVLVKLAEFRHN